MTDLTLFLKSEGSHPSGITIRDLWEMDHDEFEARHDLIQWMFPTMTPSKAQPHSPVLTWDEVLELREDEVAQNNLRNNRRYYMGFLTANEDLWLCRSNHNHLRITRVSECLGLLVSNEYQQEFMSRIAAANFKAGWPVNMQTVEFWNKSKHYRSEMEGQNR